MNAVFDADVAMIFSLPFLPTPTAISIAWRAGGLFDDSDHLYGLMIIIIINVKKDFPARKSEGRCCIAKGHGQAERTALQERQAVAGGYAGCGRAQRCFAGIKMPWPRRSDDAPCEPQDREAKQPGLRLMGPDPVSRASKDPGHVIVPIGDSAPGILVTKAAGQVWAGWPSAGRNCKAGAFPPLTGGRGGGRAASSCHRHRGVKITPAGRSTAD